MMRVSSDEGKDPRAADRVRAITPLGATEGSERQESSPRLTLVRTIAEYLPGAVVPALSGLAWSVLFTRLFTAAEYGRYSVVAATAGVAALLGYRWLEQSIIRYVPGDPAQARTMGLYDAVVLGSALSSTVLVLLFSLLVPFLPSGWLALALGGALLTLGSGGTTPLLALLTVHRQARAHSAFRITQSAARILLPVVIVLSISRDVAALAWGAALSYLVMVPLLLRQAPLPGLRDVLRRFHEATGTLRRFARYGLPMSLWFVVANLLTVGDRYVIQWFRGSAEVGIYTANYQLMQGSVMVALTPVILALNPRLMQRWEQGQRWKAIESVQETVQGLIVAGAASVGMVEILAPYLATVFLGPDFREGFGIMSVVLLGMVVWQAASYVQKPLEFHERTRELLLYVVAAAVVNFASNILLVPRYGYPAAAWTTVLSYLVYAVLAGRGARRVGGLGLDLRTVFRPVSVVALFVAAHSLVASHLIEASGWGRASLALGTVLAMLGALYVTWGRGMLQRVLGRR